MSDLPSQWKLLTEVFRQRLECWPITSFSFCVARDQASVTHMWPYPGFSMGTILDGIKILAISHFVRIACTSIDAVLRSWGSALHGYAMQSDAYIAKFAYSFQSVLATVLRSLL